MSEEWKCKECGEGNPSNYIECLNCQTMRPGFSNEWSEFFEELKRDNQEAKQERIRLNREDQNLLKLQSDNQKRFSDLLDRWEQMTDAIERKLGSGRAT